MVYPTVWRQRMPDVFGEFDRFFSRPFSADVTSAWTPEVDVREAKDELVLSAELPGLETKDVSVSVENSVLTIGGEKRQEFETTNDEGQVHIAERHYGRFERSFRLPQTVDAEKIDAKFKDGVLTVALPKVEAAKPRKIEVRVK